VAVQLTNTASSVSKYLLAMAHRIQMTLTYAHMAGWIKGHIERLNCMLEAL